MKKLIIFILACLPLTACSTVEHNIRTEQRKSDLAAYLFGGKEALGPAQKKPLTLPVKVGVTFVPGDKATADIPETTKKIVIDNVRGQLANHTKYVGGAFSIPSSYLSPKGGVNDLEKVARQFDVDVMVVLSANQFQKYERHPAAAFMDITIIGQFIIPGNTVDTNTVLEAAVYHVPSRSLIFRADGENSASSRSTLYSSGGIAQKDAVSSIEEASKKLVVSLADALIKFEKFDVSKTEEIRPSEGGNTIEKGSPRDNYWKKVGEYKSSGGGSFDIVWLSIIGVGLVCAGRKCAHR